MAAKRPPLSLVVGAGAGDAEIDRLYQLPLAEFTAARNELAKRRRDASPAIRQLPKPTVPAWAVNQVYWHERPIYDALIAAAEAVRAEHRHVLAGRAASLRDAEQAHRSAIRQAADAARRFLERAGETAAPATMSAVNETLEALPANEPAGRLARPLKPMGFEALAGVEIRAGGRPGAPALKPVPARLAPAAPARDDRALEARRRKLEKDAERARQAMDKARTALKDAEALAEKKEREAADARRAAERARKAHADAVSEHQRATRLARE